LLLLSFQAMALTQPKKPAGGAYGVFMGEKRSDFMALCKGQPITAVSKMAGDSWKKLSDKEKAPYQLKYEFAKSNFEKDMAAFLASGGVKTKGAMALSSEKRKDNDGKKKKDPNAPKKPAGGGYGVYVAENRAKIVASLPAGESKITGVAKVAGAQWKAMTEAAQKPYKATFEKNFAAWKVTMAEYKKNHPELEEAESEDEEDEEEDDAEDEEEEEEKAVPKKKARKAGA